MNTTDSRPAESPTVATCCTPAAQPDPKDAGDAAERLEAWLAQGIRRDAEITYQRGAHKWSVELRDWRLGGFYACVDDQSDLAATIHAALDEAERREAAQ